MKNVIMYSPIRLKILPPNYWGKNLIRYVWRENNKYTICIFLYSGQCLYIVHSIKPYYINQMQCTLDKNCHTLVSHIIFETVSLGNNLRIINIGYRCFSSNWRIYYIVSSSYIEAIIISHRYLTVNCIWDKIINT